MGEVKAIFVKKRTLIWKIAFAFCFAAYLAAVLWYTVGRRNAGYYPPIYDFFWSYKQWFLGDWENGKAILANIAMFIPVGFFLAAACGDSPRKAFLTVVLLSVSFSALIEMLQLFLMRGYFEYDDLFNNVFGAVLGAAVFRLMKRSLPEQSLEAALYTVCAGIVLCCGSLFLLVRDHGESSMTMLSRGLCFQVEEACYQDGRIELSGVCFWYEQNRPDFTLLLQSKKTGKCFALQTEGGIPRPDVSAYYHRDGVKAGFQAAGQGIKKNEEYEIILDFGFFRSIPTGVFLTTAQGLNRKYAGADIHFVPDDAFVPLETAGTDLEEITEKGILCVYRPFEHVFVYSYGGSLYWIVEEGFCFEDDGSTFMNVQLWTTEPEKIADSSKARGLDYDARGIDFEKAELNGNFGRYRACAWKLPTDYPITAVLMGYYKNGWVWKKNIWPCLDFSQYAVQSEVSQE